MATRMLQRRGTAADWTAQNPILSAGEIGVETDTGRIKVGNGVDNWNDLVMSWLPVSGGTMTGALVLQAPTQDTHAARLQDITAATANLGLRERLVLTATTTFVKGNYSWLRAIRARVQAAGGAGGGCAITTTGEASSGAGAGGGGYAEVFLTPDQLLTSEDVTVGVGGTGVIDGSGNNGGASSFGAHAVAAGGSGGGKQSASVTFPQVGPQGALGGTVSAGDIQVPGAPGHSGLTLGDLPGGSLGGHGGGSVLGHGGRETRDDSNGVPGFGYGGGGGGASNTGTSGAARSGGDGAPGIVIVELYA